MKPVLVLFDLDGTLLVTGGATTRAIRRTLSQLLGETVVMPSIPAGWLDQEIVKELMRNNHIPDPDTFLDRYKPLYLQILEDELRQSHADVMVLPGVLDLVETLRARPDVVTGILTGNFRHSVRLKLAAADLDETLFPVGAYAEDGKRRSDLIPVAIERAVKLTGHSFTPAQVLIIGDTPRDIDCARDGGCHVLSVATGRYSLDELTALGPDLAVRHLSDRSPVLALIKNIGSG